jgi:hypothetical protein
VFSVPLGIPQIESKLVVAPNLATAVIISELGVGLLLCYSFPQVLMSNNSLL